MTSRIIWTQFPVKFYNETHPRKRYIRGGLSPLANFHAIFEQCRKQEVASYIYDNSTVACKYWNIEYMTKCIVCI